MINYDISFNDVEDINKYQTAAYKSLISTGLTENQLEECIQKLTAIECTIFKMRIGSVFFFKKPVFLFSVFYRLY